MACLLLTLAWAGVLKAQEGKYVDLSNIRQRTELRVPPAPPSDCTEGKVCTGGEAFSIGDGAADYRDPHALAIYLSRVTPTDLNPAEPIQMEVTIRWSGDATYRPLASRTESCVFGLINDTHATTTKLFDDVVVRNRLADERLDT